jgi:hypothetical protein
MTAVGMVAESAVSPISAVWQCLRRRYAPVVGGIIIVAVWTADWGRSTVIAGGIISARGGSADRSSPYRGRADADRHSGAYTTVVATSVNPTAIDTAAVGATTIDAGSIRGGVS